MSMMNEGGPPPDDEMAPGDATEPGEMSEPGEGKQPQDAVNYRAGTPLKNCGLCGDFTGSSGPGANGCATVDGDISAFGYCDIYRKQPNPFGDQHKYAMGAGGQVAPAGGAPPGLTQIGKQTYGG